MLRVIFLEHHIVEDQSLIGRREEALAEILWTPDNKWNGNVYGRIHSINDKTPEKRNFRLTRCTNPIEGTSYAVVCSMKKWQPAGNFGWDIKRTKLYTQINVGQNLHPLQCSTRPYSHTESSYIAKRKCSKYTWSSAPRIRTLTSQSRTFFFLEGTSARLRALILSLYWPSAKYNNIKIVLPKCSFRLNLYGFDKQKPKCKEYL